MVEKMMTIMSLAFKSLRPPRELARSSTHMKPLAARLLLFQIDPAEGEGGYMTGGTGTEPLAVDVIRSQRHTSMIGHIYHRWTSTSPQKRRLFWS